MGGELQKQDLVQQLLRKSVTGQPVRIPFARDIMLASIRVAGTAYYEADGVAHQLKAGQRLALRREPGNVHDGLAVEVLDPEGHKLGYLPRSSNEIPARLMDAGKRLFLRLESVEKLDAWLKIEVTLYMEDV